MTNARRVSSRLEVVSISSALNVGVKDDRLNVKRPNSTGECVQSSVLFQEVREISNHKFLFHYFSISLLFFNFADD